MAREGIPHLERRRLNGDEYYGGVLLGMEPGVRKLSPHSDE